MKFKVPWGEGEGLSTSEQPFFFAAVNPANNQRRRVTDKSSIERSLSSKVIGETGMRQPRATESLLATFPQNNFTAGHSQTMWKNEAETSRGQRSQEGESANSIKKRFLGVQ